MPGVKEEFANDYVLVNPSPCLLRSPWYLLWVAPLISKNCWNSSTDGDKSTPPMVVQVWSPIAALGSQSKVVGACCESERSREEETNMPKKTVPVPADLESLLCRSGRKMNVVSWKNPGNHQKKHLESHLPEEPDSPELLLDIEFSCGVPISSMVRRWKWRDLTKTKWNQGKHGVGHIGPCGKIV